MRRILCSFAVLVFASVLYAQAPKDSVYYMKQVTITGTRYPAEVSRLPYAVTIIPPSEIDVRRGLGIDEVLSRVPGVLTQSRSGGQDVRLVIRGFGARGAGDRSNSGTSRGIRIMVDGIPETEPDGRTSFDQIDMSLAGEVEVIRSNTSSLWGNAAGGVVNISTIPLFSRPYNQISFTGGSYGLQKAAYRSISSLSNLQLAAGFSTSRYEGWRKHSAAKRSVLSISLKDAISEKTSLGVYLLGSSSIFHIPGPLTQQQFDADPVQPNPNYLKRDERRYNRQGRIGVSLEHKVDHLGTFSAMAYVNPKYLQRSERNTFRDFTRYHTGGNFIFTGQSSFGSDVQNTLTIGVDEAYQDGAILFYQLSATNSRGEKLTSNKREGANNFGVFLSDEVSLMDRFSLMLGARYDVISYYSDDFFSAGPAAEKRSYEKLSPKVGLSWRPNEFTSLYVNYAMGVEAPAGNETDPAATYGQDTVYMINPLLDLIRSSTVEGGVRYSLPSAVSFMEGMNLNAAVYNVTVFDDIIPYSGGKFYFTSGKTRRTGIELGGDVKLKGGVSLYCAYTWSLNKYISYKVDSVHYRKPGRFAVYDDNKVAGIPGGFYNLSLNWQPPFFRAVYLNADINGMSEYFADDANTLKVASYNIVNVGAGLADDLHLTGRLFARLAVSVNNVLDEKYAASAFINPDRDNSGRAVYLEPGLPRNYAVNFSFTLK